MSGEKETLSGSDVLRLLEKFVQDRGDLPVYIREGAIEVPLRFIRYEHRDGKPRLIVESDPSPVPGS